MAYWHQGESHEKEENHRNTLFFLFKAFCSTREEQSPRLLPPTPKILETKHLRRKSGTVPTGMEEETESASSKALRWSTQVCLCRGLAGLVS